LIFGKCRFVPVTSVFPVRNSILWEKEQKCAPDFAQSHAESRVSN
jgi:hypothetical protein